MTTVICPNCDSENAEFVPGSRCYECGSPLKQETDVSQEVTQVESAVEEDDIFCHMCDSQPRDRVVMITRGIMNGIDFEEDVDARKYYCNECLDNLTENIGDIVDIFYDN